MKTIKTYTLALFLISIGIIGGYLLKNSTKPPAPIHKHSSENIALWTCSMHPKVKQKEFGDCPICGMDLVPVKTSPKQKHPHRFRLTKNALELANIQTATVKNQPTHYTLHKLSGIITENQQTNAVQITYFSGTIEELYIRSVGERIKKGQLLATIYSPELYTAQQEFITVAALKESQPKVYHAVRNKLKLWELTDAQIQQIESTKKIQKNFPIYATVKGTVSKKMIVEGAKVQQGQVLFKMVDLNTVWANFEVYENQIHLYKKGDPIQITAHAYPNKSISGKISFISPLFNSETRTVTLRVVLENTKGLLKPGLFVEGVVKKRSSTTRIKIPVTAVLWTGKRSIIYVKTSPNEPLFEMREVVLGTKENNFYEIVSGVSLGDEIVSHGAFTVDAAAQLQSKKSMMNPQDNE